MGDKNIQPKIGNTGSRREQFILFGAIGAVTLIAIIAGFMLMRHFSPSNNTTTDTSSSAGEPLTVSERASQLADDGKYTAGQELLSKQLKDARDSQEKTDLYIEQALLAQNSGKYDEALAYAKKAEVIKKDRDTSRLIAQIYESKGDTAAALTYYKLTMARYTEVEKKNSETAVMKYYEDSKKVEELSK